MGRWVWGELWQRHPACPDGATEADVHICHLRNESQGEAGVCVSVCECV